MNKKNLYKRFFFYEILKICIKVNKSTHNIVGDKNETKIYMDRRYYKQTMS